MPIENSAFLPYYLTACMALGYLGPRRYNVFSDNMKSGACERAEITPASCGASHMPRTKHVYCTDCGQSLPRRFACNGVMAVPSADNHRINFIFFIEVYQKIRIFARYD